MKLLDAVAAVFQPRYRPEAYYMRGPGPACAAKGRAGESRAGDKPSASDADGQARNGTGDKPTR